MPDFTPIHDEIDCATLLTATQIIWKLPVIMRTSSDSILCSIPTAQIAPRMMINSYTVMKRQRRGKHSRVSIVHAKDISRMEKQFFAMPFKKTEILEKNGELSISLYPSVIFQVLRAF